MFSGPPGNLFFILTNVVFTSSFVYLCYNMCIFSHCVYKKTAKIINFLKTQKKTRKNPIKPNPYPRKGQTGIGFFWVTPPPPPPPNVICRPEGTPCSKHNDQIIYRSDTSTYINTIVPCSDTFRNSFFHRSMLKWNTSMYLVTGSPSGFLLSRPI